MLKLALCLKRNLALPKIVQELQESKKIKLFPIDGLNRSLLKQHPDIKAILVLGGDGTLLRAVPAAYKFNLPILGINMGNFGFLTENSINDLPQIIDLLEKDLIKPEKRTALLITYQKQKFVALNEGAIMKGTTGKIIYLSLFVNDGFFTTVYGDGLIISTPTGSTAYNLSAGGPIAHPKAKVFICTPICSFKINMKPFVLPDDITLKVILSKKEGLKDEEVHLLIDGHSNIIIHENTPLIFKKAPKGIYIYPSIHYSYFEILRSKFGW